jgi:hypothetical protein
LVSDHGALKIVDSTGKTQRLESGDPNTMEMIDKAETFIFAGSKYNRVEFEKVMDRMISKPGHAQKLT